MLPCICGATPHYERVVASRDQETGRIFHYRICPACSLERLWPRPRAEEIGSYYPASYAPHVGHSGGRADKLKHLIYETFWADESEIGASMIRWRWALRILLAPIRYRTALSFIPPQTRIIFEFGAARGTDLSAFKAAGWDVSGCEPSQQACELASAQGIALQNTAAECAILKQNYYTCILLNNVFEHVHDPKAVLEKCYSGLQPGGILMMIVPNHASWSAKIFGAAWPGYDAPRHLWGWTPDALHNHLASAGFRITCIHHQATGSWLWKSMLDMRHAPGRPGKLRAWLSRNASPLLVPLSIAAAFAGRGDFIRVIARKTAPAELHSF